MRYVHISRNPGQTGADYEAVRAEMGGELPTGLLVHAVGEADGGLHVVDVWESKAGVDRFAAEQLFPAFQRTGRTPGAGASYSFRDRRRPGRRAMKNLKVGLGICILLAALDVVGVLGSGTEDAPALALNILAAVIGVVTLAAMKRAFRADPTALKVVIGSRIASALLGAPVYFVVNAPTWAKFAVAAFIALTVMAVGLIVRSREPVHSAA